MTTQADQNRNYAKEVAKPLEKSLADVGGIKKCSRGADGRGPDNYEPRYMAVFEVPGDKETATKIVQGAFRDNGYNLTDGPTPGSPRDNSFYGDKTSKRSTFPTLENGNVEVILVMHGSEIHNGEGGYRCGFTASSNPPSGKTFIDFTINLPSYKGR